MSINATKHDVHDKDDVMTALTGQWEQVYKPFLRAPAKPTGGGYMVTKCPFHQPDNNPSFQFHPGSGSWNCFACDRKGSGIDFIMQVKGIGFREALEELANIAGLNREEPQAPPRLTLRMYAEAKHLPVDFLQGLGLTDGIREGNGVVLIPYRGRKGEHLRTKWRRRMAKDGPGPRFKWDDDGRGQFLYGLWRDMPGDSVLLVEGESDCHTLWMHGIPAYGVPGDNAFKPDWTKELDNRQTVYLWQEHGASGRTFVRKTLEGLHEGGFKGQIRIVSMAAFDDPSDLHIADPEGFEERIRASLSEAQEATPDADAEPSELRKPCGLSDMGNAERFKRLHIDSARYSFTHRCWYVWDGAKWREDDMGCVGQLGKEVVRDLLREAAEASADDSMRKATAKWAVSLESAAKQKAMLELARYEVPVTVEQMDAGEYLNCLNGMVDLTTGELRPHDRSLFPTKVCPVRYDPEARSGVFDSFLERIQPDPEIRRFLQRALGYSLLNGNPEEAIFIAYGPPATGKSTLLEAVAKTLGDYSEQADIRTFLEKKHDDGARPGLAKLRGARFVRSSEVPRGEKLASQLMKWISGGEQITARFLFANEFSFMPAFTVWIGTNFAPDVPDDDAAIWRRIHRIPFEQQIPEGERDPNIKAILQDPEVSGAAILAWLVRGAVEYYDNRKRGIPGLAVPEAVKADTARYRAENDPLNGFFEDCCVIEPGAQVFSGVLWSAYEQWSGGMHNVVDRKEFGRRLAAKGLQAGKITGGVRVWKGIALRHNE